MILFSLLAAALSCAAAVPAAPAPEPAAPFALRDGDRVVFYGDSITQDGAYARFVEEYVRTRFPRLERALLQRRRRGRPVTRRRLGPDRRAARARRDRAASPRSSRSCSG